MSESTTGVSEESRLCERELTRHVRLVLDNDEALYGIRREIVAEEIGGMDLGGEEGQVAAHRLEGRLKDWCEGLLGLHGPDVVRSDGLLATELLSTALAWVDWTQPAEDYIEEEVDEDG